jgi:hypothetical protein
MIDVFQILTLTLTIMGGATALLRIIAPLTKTNIDNKILKFLTTILENVALDSDSKIVSIFSGEYTLRVKLPKPKTKK